MKIATLLSFSKATPASANSISSLNTPATMQRNSIFQTGKRIAVSASLVLAFLFSFVGEGWGQVTTSIWNSINISFVFIR